MQITAAEIEAIVRVVVERLRAIDAPPAVAPIRAPIVPAISKQSLRIESRLITLEQIKGRLNDVQVVQVPVKAVVTPAVIDELRDQKIRLERIAFPAPQKISHKSAGPDSRLLIIAGHSKQLSLTLPGEFAATSEKCSADVCRIAAHINSGGRGTLWCTRTPYAALRSTVSNNSLRAVQLNDLAQLPRALQEADPNVLIVDDSECSGEALVSLANRWIGEFK